MRQFDVHVSPFRRGKEERPFIVIVQSDRYPTLSRVCAPLIAEKFLRPDGRLNPPFTILRKRCYLHPIELIALPTRVLQNPIANLEAERERIIAALDLVFTGI